MNMSLIQKSVSEALQGLGFVKSRNYWRASNNETIQIVHVEKSKLVSRLNIDLGLSIISLNQNTEVKIKDCPISHRIDMLVRDAQSNNILSSACPVLPLVNKTLDYELVNSAMYLDTNVSDLDRCTIIEKAISHFGLQFLLDFSTHDSIKRTILANKYKEAVIWGNVIDYIKNS